MLHRSLPLLSVLAIFACAPGTSPATREPAAPDRTGPAAKDRRVAALVISGRITGPAGILSNNGGRLISDKGSGIVSEHGNGYRVQAIAEVPYAGVEVFLADAGSGPIPSIRAVKADAQGRYEIRDVPAGHTFVVVARFIDDEGKQQLLRTLVKSGELGATADVSAATTFVTTAVLEGGKGELGEYNPATFSRVLRATGERLTDADGKLIKNPTAILQRMSELAASVAEIKSALGELRADVARLEASLDDLKAKVDALSKATPTPGAATPTPGAATPTPSATATAAPTPAVAPGNFVVLAGDGAGFLDGAGAAARFNAPAGMALDTQGNLYVADSQNNRVRKVSPAGEVSTLAPGMSFNQPSGVAVGKDGAVYVADTYNHRIRRIAPDGTVTTLAGAGVAGYADGNGEDARFDRPRDVAVAVDGTVFVADNYNHCLRKIAPDGTVTTFAGAKEGGARDGRGGEARFATPWGLALAADGTLYVSDLDNNRVCKVAADGTVSTLAGGAYGQADGTGAAAQFAAPRGLALDRAGNLIVADWENHKLRHVTPAGVVTTLAGGAAGQATGAFAATRFIKPAGVAVSGAGELFVGDESHRVRKGQLPD